MIEVRTRQLLSPQDAARKLNIGVRRLAQLAESGELESVTDSGRRRTFPIEAVEALARERAQKAAGAK